MKCKSTQTIIGSLLMGLAVGWASNFLPGYLSAILGALSCSVCCFFGMLIGYVLGHQSLRHVVQKNQEMEKAFMERVGRVSVLVSSSAHAVADKVAVRMAYEVFKNSGNEEHREAAILRGAEIVEEEIKALEESIEEFRGVD